MFETLLIALNTGLLLYLMYRLKEVSETLKKMQGKTPDELPRAVSYYPRRQRITVGGEGRRYEQ